MTLYSVHDYLSFANKMSKRIGKKINKNFFFDFLDHIKELEINALKITQ